MSKHISYIVPVEYMTGNISGRQELDYVQGGDGAYAAPDGQKTSATNYDPRLIAKRKRPNGPDDGCLYFQVRTKTSVNMTAAMRLNMAALGGAGALFASLLRNKTALIYAQCAAATPKGTTMRAFIVPLLIAGLTAKEARITIADNVYIVNPWTSEDVPNVPISLDILNKFARVLGQVVSPYNAATTEYLQTTYPDNWNGIILYGLNNPSQVAYIEEDPDLICSLMDVGVTRWLYNNNSAYIDTGLILSNNSEIYITFKGININQNGFGAGISTTNTRIIIRHTSTDKWRIGYNSTQHDFDIGNNVTQTISIVKNVATVNGTQYTFTEQTYVTPVSARIFGFNTETSGSVADMSVAHMRIGENGVIIRDMYPFIRNNASGMLDILTGTFYLNAGTGAFTIEKTANS